MDATAQENAPAPAKAEGRKEDRSESSPQAAPATTTLVPDYQKSLAFLRLLYPDGPWVLTAIEPDKKSIETRTFAEESDVLAWLQKHGTTRNLYYSVNRTREPIYKKAERSDIREVVFLHVDVDPRAGEDIAVEQARALDLLRNGHKGLPTPTAIVFSGGGYNALWKLESPIPTNGDQGQIELATRYNQQIEFLLGADSCHNIDRILRLPGTINRPDDRKRRKGRTPALATLVEWNADAVYPLAKFSPAPKVQTPGGDGASATVRVDTASVHRPASVDDLPAAVADWAKVLIVQGHDPEHPGKYPSRSEALFAVCCELVRGGCDDATIYSVITDPDFAISASVLDKGRGAEKYALRQIASAREAVAGDDGDVIACINRSYFAALEGQKVTFYREEGDGSVTPMNAEAFAFELGDQRIQVPDGKGGSRELEAVKVWRTHPRRRYYRRGFVLDPAKSGSADQYNLWKGFGVEPKPGRWPAMREHIERVLSGGNAAYADYILRWTAWSLQNPATPPRVALVFRGDEGTGKGVFCNALVRAFGHHGLRVQDMNQVAGRFNAHLRHCCLLFADEVSLVSVDQEGTLKGMITEASVATEAKGRDIVRADNHLHVVMATNRTWALSASDGARRFAMFDVPSTYKGDKAYFDALWAELEGDGLAAMIHDLLALDLDGWHPEKHRPDTAALNEQKAMSLPSLDRAWLDCLEGGTLPLGRELGEGAYLLPTVPFLDWVAQRCRRSDAVSPNRLASLFGTSKRGMGFSKCDGERPRGWVVPPLAEARARWDRQRFAMQWDTADVWHCGVAADGALPF